jgi:hypothetical protein
MAACGALLVCLVLLAILVFANGLDATVVDGFASSLCFNFPGFCPAGRFALAASLGAGACRAMGAAALAADFRAATGEACLAVVVAAAFVART